MKHAAFDMFLDRLDPTVRADQLAFFRAVGAVGLGAQEELANRVHRVSCPLGLKQLTLEFIYYFPAPEWMGLVERLIRHEKDLSLFVTGVRALGRIRTPEALAALRELAQSRAATGFRDIIDLVLQESDPAEAFHYHFSRLLQGSAQPSDANEGAHQLATLLTPDSLEPLKAAIGHPAPLIFRHALSLVGQIPSAEAAAFLVEYLKEVHLDALEDREARALLTAWRSLPRPDVQEKALKALSARWGERPPESLAALASGQQDQIHQATADLSELGLGLLDTLLVDALQAAAEDKPAHLAKFMSQAGDAAQQRLRRIDFAMNSVAQDLAGMAARGFLPPEALLPILGESLRQGTARVGVASALASLVGPGDQASLDLLLDDSDGTHRSAALEILGTRGETAFRPVFMRLRRDPISDIADRSLWHLGQLPEAAATARAFLADPDLLEVHLGLRFIGMHRLGELLPDLLTLVASEVREATFLATLETLGTLGLPEAVTPLLALLHSGQGPRIQLALAETLRDLSDPGGALALCAKAEELKTPELHAVAVEALAKAYGTPERPLPTTASSALAAAVRGGWSDRNPWPLRRRLGEGLLALHVEDKGVWMELSSLFQSTLGEKRPSSGVSPEDLARLQACTRTLAQWASA